MTTIQNSLISKNLRYAAIGLATVAVTSGLAGEGMKHAGLPYWDGALFISSTTLILLALTGLVIGVQIARRQFLGKAGGPHIIPPTLAQSIWLAGSLSFLGGVVGQSLTVLSVDGGFLLLKIAFVGGALFLALSIAAAGTALYRTLA